MKLLKSAGLVVIALFLSISFLEAKFTKDTFRDVKTENRKTGPFNSIDVSTGIKLFLSQGNTQSIKVEADDNVIGDLKTQVSGSTLRIYMDHHDSGTWNNIRVLKVYVTCPDLNSLVTGSGSRTEVAGTWKARRSFNLEASSGSSVTMALHASSLKCESSSGSSVDLTVTADKLRLTSSSGSTIRVDGSGTSLNAEASSGSSIKAQNLKVENCVADASSASTVRVNVSRELDASATSVARVSYIGRPAKIERNVSSLGKVSED